MKKLCLSILLFIPFLLHAQEKGTDQKGPQLSRALEVEYRALHTATDRKDTIAMAHSYGNLGKIYLDIAKEVSDDSKQSDSEKNALGKSVECLNNSIHYGEVTGDIAIMKKSYKYLCAAQKLSGNVAGALDSYRKMVSLKYNAKKTHEIERKQLEYKYGKREDSLLSKKQVVEENLKEQSKILSQKQQELQLTSQTLSTTEKEKNAASSALHQTQSELNVEKSNTEEQKRKLIQAEQEKALQAANLELQQSKLQLQKDELAKKDSDIQEHRKERNFYILGLIALLVISLLAYRTIRVQKKYNAELFTEKQRSENLLLNILPAEVAEELKEKGFADARHFYDVTVLFTDFVSFTAVAETMTPQQLVGELHVCFKAFDDILGKYQIEKIKTVGDAYMAVSGLPIANPDHASHILAAAREICDFMLHRKAEMGNKTFGIRIGVNSGNVVAGIVGVRKFAYDIWGDTVNIAARMEQNSEEGKINMSATTYQLVKDKYKCVHRGKIEAKNKGNIDMYYLS